MQRLSTFFISEPGSSEKPLKTLDLRRHFEPATDCAIDLLEAMACIGAFGFTRQDAFPALLGRGPKTRFSANDGARLRGDVDFGIYGGVGLERFAASPDRSPPAW